MSFIKISNILEAILSSQDSDPVYNRYLQRVELAARAYCKEKNINIQDHWFHEFPNGEIFPDRETAGSTPIVIGGKSIAWRDYVISHISNDLGKKTANLPNEGMLYADIRDYRENLKGIDDIYYQYLGNVLAAARLFCFTNQYNLQKHIFHVYKDSRLRPDLLLKGANKMMIAGEEITWDQLTGSPAFLITSDITALVDAELDKLKAAVPSANKFDSIDKEIKELMQRTVDGLDAIIKKIKEMPGEETESHKILTKVKTLKRKVEWN